MKKTNMKVIILVILIVGIIFSAVSVLANNERTKHIQNQDSIAIDAKAVTEDTRNKIADSLDEEKKRYFQHLKKREDIIIRDIENSFNIDRTEYMLFTGSDFPAVFNKEIKEIQDDEFINILTLYYRQFTSSLEKGSYKPCLFINRDNNKIIFATKDSEGKNISLQLTKINNTWEDNSIIKDGITIEEADALIEN